MGIRELKIKLDEIVSQMCDELRDNLDDSLAGITFSGSYVVGDVASDRPDVDLFVFFKDRAVGDDYLELGKIWNDIQKRYSDLFNVRFEFRPFRFIYPKDYDKTKLDLFINPIIANVADRELDFPFGIPKYVLSGFCETRKVYYGEDVLASLDLSFSYEDMKQGILRDLSIFNFQVSRAPAQYDFKDEYYLLYNEALCMAKFVMYCGIQVAMDEEEINNREYIEYLTNKTKIPGFYFERYNQEVAEMAQFILDARVDYSNWRFDKEKTRRLYNVAFIMMGAVLNRLNN